jgi:predicted outer membrane repeat protein
LEGRTLMSGLSLTAATVSDLIADINAANTAGGANTITLAAPTTSPYVLTAVNNSTNGATGLPVIAANDNLTIVGSGDTIERNTAASTPDFRLLAVAGGGSLTLENLTLQGGYDASGYYGGGAIYNQGTLVLNDVTVQQNTALGAGGGIYSSSGSVVTLEGGTIVQSNVAITAYLSGEDGFGGDIPTYGGGLYASGGTVTVTNATLDKNFAEGEYGYGGGLYVQLGTVMTLSNDAVESNTADGNGGGLCVQGGTVSLSNDTIKSNYAEFNGGGLYVVGSGTYGNATVTLSNDTVESNKATGGGGLFVVSSGTYGNATVTLSYDTVESNTAYNSKGGAGGGLYVSGGSNVTLANDTVESNSAAYGYGGGLYVYQSTVSLSNDTVESNSAMSWGGGLYVYQGAVTLTNDTVESNSAKSAGGGIYIKSGTVYLDSFTVANTINNTDESGLNGSTANIDGTYILQNP